MVLPTYPWYAVMERNKPLEQGDILRECPVIVPEGIPDIENKVVPVQVKITRAIILTQSCDLIQKRVSNVVLCPLYLLGERQEFASKDKHESLCQ